ncbi:MAG: hypothetical protein L6R40_005217 [Gallowayella cf. fulva]|nr:MAG: hypothetical protein L6R40_005217 [Xanthomendoza cf. fulva]
MKDISELRVEPLLPPLETISLNGDALTGYDFDVERTVTRKKSIRTTFRLQYWSRHLAENMMTRSRVLAFLYSNAGSWPLCILTQGYVGFLGHSAKLGLGSTELLEEDAPLGSLDTVSYRFEDRVERIQGEQVPKPSTQCR